MFAAVCAPCALEKNNTGKGFLNVYKQLQVFLNCTCQHYLIVGLKKNCKKAKNLFNLTDLGPSFKVFTALKVNVSLDSHDQW